MSREGGVRRKEQHEQRKMQYGFRECRVEWGNGLTKDIVRDARDVLNVIC